MSAVASINIDIVNPHSAEGQVLLMRWNSELLHNPNLNGSAKLVAGTLNVIFRTRGVPALVTIEELAKLTSLSTRTVQMALKDDLKGVWVRSQPDRHGQRFWPLRPFTGNDLFAGDYLPPPTLASPPTNSTNGSRDSTQQFHSHREGNMLRIYLDKTSREFQVQTDCLDLDSFIEQFSAALLKLMMSMNLPEQWEESNSSLIRNMLPIAFKLAGYKAEQVREERVLTCGHVSLLDAKPFVELGLRAYQQPATKDGNS